MSEQKQFTIELDQLQGYEFKVRFDLDGIEPLLLDEPAPIGQGRGPNPSRLVAAAAANCLGASLLYCVSKNQPPQGSLRASATCTLGRNEQGRLRITGIDVRLELAATLEQAARTKRQPARGLSRIRRGAQRTRRNPASGCCLVRVRISMRVTCAARLPC